MFHQSICFFAGPHHSAFSIKINKMLYYYSKKLFICFCENCYFVGIFYLIWNVRCMQMRFYMFYIYVASICAFYAIVEFHFDNIQ